MSEYMVKKSVDITKQDDNWLEKQPINFSKFVRTKIAEKRYEELDKQKKKNLLEEIKGLIKRGLELEKKYKEEKSNLQDQYDVKVVEQQLEYFLIEYEGEQYTAHWQPEHALDDCPKDVPEPVEEFGNKFIEVGFDRIDKLGDFVGNETSFEFAGQTEFTQTLEGTGSIEQFTVRTKHVPTDIDDVDIEFEDRVVIEIQNLEKTVQSEF